MELNQNEKIKNIILTIIQYSMLTTFVIVGSNLALGIVGLAVEIIGIAIGFWAVIAMNESKIHIAPKPRSGSVLIQKGPYKLIRHPMYLAIIVTFIPILISHFSFLRLAIMAVLTINLFVKLNFEETLLKKHFVDYEEYTKKSKKIIPYIY
jgi:protein-S-isoprenylcysteine O-methyltransferase Ste14